VLPDLLPNQLGIQKDHSLTPPPTCFAFLLQVPNVDGFFAHLVAWLTGRVYNNSQPGLLTNPAFSFWRAPSLACWYWTALRKYKKTVCVGATLGQISDGRLKELVVRIGDGFMKEVRLLVTTRFRLSDLMQRRCPFNSSILVQNLDPKTAFSVNERTWCCKGH